jgi:hypothetical protein
MQTLRNSLKSLDALLDRHHYQTIVLFLGTGVLAYVIPRRDERAIIETAFTLDWILAAAGLGVLVHLLTRR